MPGRLRHEPLQPMPRLVILNLLQNPLYHIDCGQTRRSSPRALLNPAPARDDSAFGVGAVPYSFVFGIAASSTVSRLGNKPWGSASVSCEWAKTPAFALPRPLAVPRKPVAEGSRLNAWLHWRTLQAESNCVRAKCRTETGCCPRLRPTVAGHLCDPILFLLTAAYASGMCRPLVRPAPALPPTQARRGARTPH